MRTWTVFKVLLTNFNVYIRQIIVLAAVLTVCGFFVSGSNYEIISILEWYGSVEAPYLGKAPIANWAEYLENPGIPDRVTEKAYQSFIELKGAEVCKPSADPREVWGATRTHLIIAPEKEFANIAGAGNLLKQIATPDPTRRGAWLDYNTASIIGCGIGDRLWIRFSDMDRSGMIVFEFEIRGITKPYFDTAPPNHIRGIVLVEESNVTDKMLSQLNSTSNMSSLEAVNINVLLPAKPVGSTGDFSVLSKAEARIAALGQLFNSIQLIIIFAYTTASCLLITLVFSRESFRVLNSSAYPASVLISLGVSTASIRRHFLALQYVCFVVAALVALAILKFFLFQQLVGWYFGSGLFWLNIVFWTLLYSVIMLASKQVRRLSGLSLLTLHKQKEEMM